ncbi:MAG TPA: hypothetical protein VGN37_08315 [Actinocatenispora sp.]
MPATWSLTALSQVMPRLNPKYFGDGAAFTLRTGTTNRSPSTEASSPSPQNCTTGISAWAAISAAFAPSLSTFSFTRPSPCTSMDTFAAGPAS